LDGYTRRPTDRPLTKKACAKSARVYCCASVAFLPRSRVATLPAVIKRHTGIDLAGTRAFLLNECFIPGQGFRSQYVDQSTVSCTTTAICIYALCQTGALTRLQKREFERVLLGFRLKDAPQAAAFPRTTGQTASVWTTGQAVLALLSLGSSWETLKS